jgi:chromosome segregation ATPase
MDDRILANTVERVEKLESATSDLRGNMTSLQTELQKMNFTLEFFEKKRDMIDRSLSKDMKYLREKMDAFQDEFPCDEKKNHIRTSDIVTWLVMICVMLVTVWAAVAKGAS